MADDDWLKYLRLWRDYGIICLDGNAHMDPENERQSRGAKQSEEVVQGRIEGSGFYLMHVFSDF